jgi:hypothetical protein
VKEFSRRTQGQRSRTETTSHEGAAAPPPGLADPPSSWPPQDARTAEPPAASLVRELGFDLVVVGAASCFVVMPSVRKTPPGPGPRGGYFHSSQSISGPGNGLHCEGWPSGSSLGLLPLHPCAHPHRPGRSNPIRREKASHDALRPGTHSCCQTPRGMSASGSNPQRADMKPGIGEAACRQPIGGWRRRRSAERAHRPIARVVQQNQQHIRGTRRRTQRLNRREFRLRVPRVIRRQPDRRPVRNRQTRPRPISHDL